MYTEGGIYLDSDVMVFERFDHFLSHGAFSSVEIVEEMFSWRNDSDWFSQHSGFGIHAQ